MKFIITLMTAFLYLLPTAFGELTTTDIDKIRLIVKEEIAASEARMKAEIAASEARMKAEIAASEAQIRSDIDGKIGTVNATLIQMDKRLDSHFMLLLALFAFVGIVIGIPQIIVALQRRTQHTQNEKIEAQQKEITLLRTEMKALREERAINPH